MYNNKYSDQLLPLITPEMLTRYPDQTCDILNKLIRLAQQSSGGTVVEGGTGNLEDIIQTTTSYDDGGVNVVTAYLSDGTTQDFQIRNGHKGSQGEDGESATIAVGTTSTLPAGSSATVVNSGTSSAAVLDFGIPKGDTGADGQDGADGFSPIANVTKVGDTATITITDKDGTTTASVTDGSDGTAATIAAGTTTTLPAGSSATVTNSGTSSAAVFDFGIPKGDTGAAGQDGADGFSPIATVSKVGDTATITITDENGTTTASVTDGSDGAPGAAATISAGTTTTLPAGSSATVTNSGTSSAAVFDFGIPQGATGATGPANTLSIGTVQSGATADATITGTSPNQTLNLTLPEGPQGQPGSPGPKGDPGAGCPIGTILPFSGSTIPDNYLECNGQAVSRTTYADLFAVIGTTYGTGDGSTTFNLPNLKGKVAVGQDTSDTSFDTLGETGGEKTHQLTISEMPKHQHDVKNPYDATWTNQVMVPSTSGTASKNDPSYTWQPTDFTGGDGYHNNLQPYIVTKFIIKYADAAATVADVLNAYSSSSTDVYSASYANTKFMYSAEAGSNITIDGLAAYLSGKQGMTGSVNLTQKSSGVGSSIPAGWYNYFWSPHRTGIGGDNDEYGTIILTPMTSDGSSWILRKSSSTTTITSVKRILTDTVSTSQIANTAVTAGKIDFTTFADDQSNIRKIYYVDFSGTPDSNGFLAIPTSAVTPSNGVVIGVRSRGNYDGFYIPYCDNNASRWTVRHLNWGLGPMTSYFEARAIYIKV